MAESDSSEKTEEPTEQKKRKAREQGQIPRSRELGHLLILGGGALGLLTFGGYIGSHITAVMVQSFNFTRDDAFNKEAIMLKFADYFLAVMLPILPFMVILLLMGFISNIILGGMNFSKKAMAPNFGKMNPLKGLKRMVSLQSLVELLKSVLKVALIVPVAVFYLKLNFAAFTQMALMPVNAAIQKGFYLVGWGFFLMAIVVLLIVAIDIPYQLYSNKQKLMMSMQEIKDEFKQTEGKPEVKQKRRQLQYQMSQGRMMGNVPDADVVITNPTHFAVALRYQDQVDEAPTCIAKGGDLIAEKIREVAIAHNVTLVEAPPLARSLFYTTEIDEEIPEPLFVAVAQILAYVYQLKRFQARQASKPKLPKEYDIPVGYQY